MGKMLTLEGPLQFLAGGGECGRLIRSYDWSKTSLGHPSGWPASLKTCVRIILTSRQPMFVWWGVDLINIHNDPYRDILGGKHPRALGQPASEVWKEIWPQISLRVDSAINDNEGTYDEALLLIMERNGYPEETYYTFSYSPVPGEDGSPAGIICANTDDTERIISERQLRTLKDLGKAYAGVTSDRQIYEGTIAVLTQNPHDFPFAAIYQAEDEDTLSLAAKTANLPNELTPPVIRSDTKSIWPLTEVMAWKKELLYNVFDTDLPKGIWAYPPRQVLAMPIASSGQAKPYGVLLVGLNRYRLFDERYEGFFGLLTDQVATGIANVRTYEEEKKRVAALMEIDKAKTVFFNNVSHEFRTPLTLMLGPVEELLRQQDDSMPQFFRDNTQAIHRNAQRLLKLVNSLLEFSRIEAGRVAALYKPVNISAITADLASGFRSIIEKAGLFFQVDCVPVKKPVYVDPEMWEKIILNLLSNAFKYTLSGGIKLTLKQDKNDVVLAVEDTGVGIPANELPHMFERFHRVHGSEGRTHEGTGIGLSLIHELVKLHGGSIEVTSAVGQGSVFTVKIPAGKAHLAPEHVSEVASVQAISALSGVFINEAASLLGDTDENQAVGSNAKDPDDAVADKSTRILIADDNPDMRAYLRRLLDPYYTVSVASNGKEALEKIASFKPNLLVSDVMMPVMDGKELLKAIRSHIHTLRLPVILLSARAGEEARIEGLEAGADDYLVKPFSARELLTKIRSHVNIAKARTHAEELLRTLFVNAPVAIAIMRGPQLIIELANQSLLEIWGRGIEDVIDKPLMTALPELEGQGFDLLLKEVMSTGKRFVSSEREANIVRKKRLQKIYVTFIYEPLREADGAISGVIVLAHEITDLVNARQSAQQNAEELGYLVTQRDEFLSIASHELKTPVTGMKAALQVLDRMELPNSPANGFVKMAVRQVNRLAELVSDLLDVSSLQAGKMQFYFEQFKLDDMVKDVIDQYRQSQNHHRIELECTCTGLLTADRNRLEQVVSNLVSNALKYSPDADKIIIRCGTENGQIKVSVTDFGIGIPDDNLDRVFERFFRVEESANSFSGLGLGLYISSEIIKRHEGAIGVHSNSPQGSVFWFTLPAPN